MSGPSEFDAGGETQDLPEVTPGGETTSLPAEGVERPVDETASMIEGGDEAPARPNWKARIKAGLGAHEEQRAKVIEEEDEQTFRSDRFEVIRELGRGGMGAVLEVRDARLGRTVALKLLLGGAWASPRAQQRFEVEARAAARLEHENIVKVYEVGREGGQRFLVLELVKGESLAARIERDGPLPPREAARIAADLADALAYAHEQSILHRDVKPANVLLTTEGVPKLADFGLAKSVEQDAGGLTSSGVALGTPVYMPPEQARGDHERIDRRADVYSLGATLYQMLTGEPPFNGRSVPEVIQKVIGTEPRSPVELRGGVDRDIETICLKCLEKEPERRYLSASALAEDLRRYQADEPILARPPTTGDRLVKWVKRNRAVAKTGGVVGGIALAVIAAGTIAFVQRLQERTEEAQLAAEDARRQEARAQRAYEDMVFKLQDRLGKLPYEDARLAREELLEGALGELRQGLEGTQRDPLLRAAAERRYAVLLGVVGREQESEEGLRQAVASYRPLVQDAERAADARLGLALTLERLADRVRARGAMEEAGALIEESIALSRQTPLDPEHRRRLAGGLSRSSVLLREHGDLAGALERSREAVNLLRALLAATPGDRRARMDASIGLAHLGLVLKDRGSLHEARDAVSEALALRRALVKEDPGDDASRSALASLLKSQGRVLELLGDLGGCLKAYEEALAIRARQVQLDPNNAVAVGDHNVALGGLADAYEAFGDVDKAQELYLELREGQQRYLALMPNDLQARRNLAFARNRLGAVYADRGDVKEARTELAAARSLFEDCRADAPADAVLRLDLASVLNNLGELERTVGAMEEAAALHEEARSLLAGDEEEGAFRVLREIANTTDHLGDLHEARDDPDAALAAFEDGLRVRQRARARQDNTSTRRDLLVSYIKLIRLLTTEGRLKRAQELGGELEAVMAELAEEKVAPQFVLRGLAVGTEAVAKLRLAEGDAEAAREGFTRALQRQRALLSGQPDNVDHIANLAAMLQGSTDVLKACGDVQGMFAAQRKSIALRRKVHAQRQDAGSRYFLVNALTVFGNIATREGEFEAALETLREAETLGQSATTERGRRALLQGLFKQAELHKKRGEHAVALEVYERIRPLALVLFNQRATPTAVEFVNVCLENLGELRLAAKNTEGGLEAYAAWLAHLEKRGASGAALGRALLRVGEGQLAVGQETEALASFERAAKQLQESASAKDRRNATIAWLRIGDALRPRDLAKSIPPYESSLALAQALAKELDTPAARRDLGSVCLQLGQAYLDAKDYAGARRVFEEALTVRQRALGEAPGDVDRVRDVFLVHMQLGNALRGLAEHEAALEAFGAALNNARERFAKTRGSTSCREMSVMLLRMSEVYTDQDRRADAAACLREAVANHERLVRAIPSLASELKIFQKRLATVEGSDPLLSGTRAPQTPAEHLRLGYARYGEKRYAESAQAFAAALVDAEVRGDLDRGNLYNGACASSLAAAATEEGEEREKLLDQALEWLTADLVARRERLAKLEAEPASEARDARLADLRAREAKHREHARVKDTDLALLREHEGFGSLFEE